MVTRELRHAVNRKAIKREVDSAKHRAVCGKTAVTSRALYLADDDSGPDFCSSTIFSGYFLCKKCGRDFCIQCEHYFSDSLEDMRESPWHLPDAARPRLLRCTGGADAAKTETEMTNEKKRLLKVHHVNHFHVRPDLQPVSRFTADELEHHWLALVEFVLGGTESEEDRLQLLGITKDEVELREMISNWMIEHGKRKEANGDIKTALYKEEIADLYRKTANPAGDPIPDPAELEDLSLPFILISADRLNNDAFDQLWARGEPIIVDGVGKRLKHSWTPDTFIERSGQEPCCIVKIRKADSDVLTAT